MCKLNNTTAARQPLLSNSMKSASFVPRRPWSQRRSCGWKDCISSRVQHTCHWEVESHLSAECTGCSKWKPLMLFRWDCCHQLWDRSCLKTQCSFTDYSKRKCSSHFGYGYFGKVWLVWNWLGPSDTYPWWCQVDFRETFTWICAVSVSVSCSCFSHLWSRHHSLFTVLCTCRHNRLWAMGPALHPPSQLEKC